MLRDCPKQHAFGLEEQCLIEGHLARDARWGKTRSAVGRNVNDSDDDDDEDDDSDDVDDDDGDDDNDDDSDS